MVMVRVTKEVHKRLKYIQYELYRLDVILSISDVIESLLDSNELEIKDFKKKSVK